MKKKPSAADRPQFRRDLLKTLAELKPEIAEVDSDVTILCTRAEDFDPANNVLWELEANRSEPRDVRCFHCGKQVAMSNHAFAGYSKLDKKPRVCCVHCVESLPKDEGKP